MNYHNITKCDMLNGDGIRVVLWVSGCSCHCYKCQNPQTWDFDSGILFDEAAKQELYEALSQNYIKGISFSGGHPLDIRNRKEIFELIKEIKIKFPDKDIWVYTGYAWEELLEYNDIRLNLFNIDILVDGRYIEEQRDITLPFRGSSNQRIIDVKKSIQNDMKVVEIDYAKYS